MNVHKPNFQQPTFQTDPVSKSIHHDNIQTDLSLAQQQHLEALITPYTERTKTSKKLAQNYRSVFANNRGSAGFNFTLKELFYPILIKRSLGSKIWDVDDNEYVDLTAGRGLHLCGYNPPFIKKALLEQLEQGIQTGPQAALAGEVAELICELTGVERVAFCSVGTEAVMLALRLARAATGRSKIALFSNSYHGIFDGTLVKAQTVNGNSRTVPEYPGVTPNIAEDVLVLDYGSSESLEIIRAYEHELAAVLVEPVQQSRLSFEPKAFLQQLRQLTKESGIALIFDEMVTGFRIHPGGAQAWFGIEADLVTYGKTIAGGMPMAVVAGKANYMDGIDGGIWNYDDVSYPHVPITWSGTSYSRHSMSLAAARAFLEHLKMQGPVLQQKLNQRTSEFVTKLNTYFEEDKLPLQIVHFGSIFSPDSSANSELLANYTNLIGMKLLTYHLFHKGFFPVKEERAIYLQYIQMKN
ncbi:aspartate aminotransferase family protein [Nostoc sp. KVJ3]|uniref:aspartate aminotransferase family protein n=1 Tax=Nostoc sp. KVJ3 TaxID=457945 RepID=UPI00223798E8|nr:aminotransferase class III-fold pyridoxal phosphate-dependent enzyme [Nostoc sp. KVJ3]